MNPPRRAYCRTFQTVFRLALPLLPYREPEALDTVEEAADLLKREGKRHPLIVTDATVHRLGLIDGLLAALDRAGIAHSVFDETVANPTIANVEAARARYLADGCDAIVAFGGGSSMDCAKAAGARIVKPRQPVAKMRGIHGVAHALGGQYGIPHGLANAVVCPYVLDLYGASCHKRLGQLSRRCGIAPEGASDADASAAFIAWFRELNASMGIPEKLEGIREQDIPLMADHADKESNPLYPVPRLMDARELEQVFRLVMA